MLNRYIGVFEQRRLPIYMTRDWHPPNHCSFKEYGGPWPPHCVAESRGAAFSEELKFNSPTTIVSKATTPERECYSDFGTTNFEADLRAKGFHGSLLAALRRIIASSTPSRMRSLSALRRSFFVMPFVVST